MKIGEEMIVRRRPAGNLCNKFKAEMIAMTEAVKAVRGRNLKKVNVWTDYKALAKEIRSYRVSSDERLKELENC